MTANTVRCPRCGQEVVPGGDVQGLCPNCMIEFAFGEDPHATRQDPGVVPSAIVEDPLIGRRFGPYEIEARLGQGGMGVVYRARHSSLDRTVAIKVLPEELARDAAFTARFQREARALASLSHPHIVGVHDFGCIDGRYYFAMEFVDGPSLRELMHDGKITPERALAIVPPLCDALQYAHQQGVVHRDIKPENILLDTRGNVKIADFGLAKVVGAEAEPRGLTRSNMVMGTLHYMAPEQVERPKEVDHRADIYSLGVVYYEMLTGELPLGRFDPPSRRVQVSVSLDEVVLKTLEKRPERRYQQVSEVKVDTERISRAPGGFGATDVRAAADAWAGVKRTEADAQAALGRAGAEAGEPTRMAGYGVLAEETPGSEAGSRWPAPKGASGAGRTRRVPIAAALVAGGVALVMGAGLTSYLLLSARRSPSAAVAPPFMTTRPVPSPVAVATKPATATVHYGPVEVLEPAEGVLLPEENSITMGMPAEGTAIVIGGTPAAAAETARLAELRRQKEAVRARLYEYGPLRETHALGAAIYDKSVQRFDELERELALSEERKANLWRPPTAAEVEAEQWLEKLGGVATAAERRTAYLELVKLWPRMSERLHEVEYGDDDRNQGAGKVLAEYDLIALFRKAGSEDPRYWQAAWEIRRDDPERFRAMFFAVLKGRDSAGVAESAQSEAAANDAVAALERELDLAETVLARFMDGWSEVTDDRTRDAMNALESEVRGQGLRIFPGLVRILSADPRAAFGRMTEEPFGSVWTRKPTARDQVKAIFGLAWLGRREALPLLARHLDSPSLTAATNAAGAMELLSGKKFGEHGIHGENAVERARNWWQAERAKQEADASKDE